MKIFGWITTLTDGYQDGIFTILGAGVFLQANKMMDNTLSIANFIVSWGMAFIVGYGVIRITLNLIWNILFGKNFRWKIGILERLFRRLKPMKAQEIAERTDEENEKKALRYMRKVMKTRAKRGGVKRMGFKKFIQKVNANKWTILGAGSVVAVGALGAFGVINPGNALEVVKGAEGMNNATLQDGIISLTAMGAAAALNLRGVFGKGPESVDNYTERKQVEAAAKMAKAKAKEDGTLEEAKTIKKLVKDFGITEAKAKEIAVEKTNIKKAELAKKEKEVEAAKVTKIAKKLGITEAKAKTLL